MTLDRLTLPMVQKAKARLREILVGDKIPKAVRLGKKLLFFIKRYSKHSFIGHISHVRNLFYL